MESDSTQKQGVAVGVPAQPGPAGAASVPHGAAELFERSLTAGADQVTVTCSEAGAVTAHAKRTPPPSPAQPPPQQASATARAAAAAAAKLKLSARCPLPKLLLRAIRDILLNGTPPVHVPLPSVDAQRVRLHPGEDRTMRAGPAVHEDMLDKVLAFRKGTFKHMKAKCTNAILTSTAGLPTNRHMVLIGVPLTGEVVGIVPDVFFVCAAVNEAEDNLLPAPNTRLGAIVARFFPELPDHTIDARDTWLGDGPRSMAMMAHNDALIADGVIRAK
jgi:hypothetical protein